MVTSVLVKYMGVNAGVIGVDCCLYMQWLILHRDMGTGAYEDIVYGFR